MTRFALACLLPLPLGAQDGPLRIVIAGLAHGHVSGFLNAGFTLLRRAAGKRLCQG
jgi:hypothetical protein